MIDRLMLAAALMSLPVMATAQGQPGSLEARIQRIEDELAIRRILVDYAAFLDGRDYARYAALFTADGEWTGGGGSHKGQAAIRGMLETVLGKPGAPNRANFHIISNPQVDLTGDRATARSRYLFVMRAPDGRPQPSLAGIYTDELVREKGQWKIRRRVADDIMPTAEEWGKIIAAQQQAPQR